MRQGMTPAVFAVLLWSGGIAARAGDGVPVLSDARLGTRVAPLLLLSRTDVQTDLGLSPDQVASSQRIIDELHVRAEALRGKPNRPDVIAARQAIDDSQKRWLMSALTEPQQTRLLQIDLQWEGPSALVSRPSVSEALKLSSEQARTLREAVAQRLRTPDPQAERKLGEQALTILSSEQRERWKAMLGRPFLVGGAQTASGTPLDTTRR